MNESRENVPYHCTLEYSTYVYTVPRLTLMYLCIFCAKSQEEGEGGGGRILLMHKSKKTSR